MSEEPEAGEEKPPEAVTDEELDDVAGGTAKASVVKSPIKDDSSFISFPPQFIAVMPYHEAGATDSTGARRSVSDLFAELAND